MKWPLQEMCNGMAADDAVLRRTANLVGSGRAPLLAVVQAANLWNGNNAARSWALRRPRYRCILRQGYPMLPTVTMVGLTLPDLPSGVHKIEMVYAGRASPPVYLPLSRSDRSIAGNVAILEPSSRGETLKSIHVRAKGSCGTMDAYANDNGDYVVDACSGGNRFGLNGKGTFYSWEEDKSVSARTTAEPVLLPPVKRDKVIKAKLVKLDPTNPAARLKWEPNDDRIVRAATPVLNALLEQALTRKDQQHRRSLQESPDEGEGN